MAALLSFLIPGLGQAYRGRWALGLLFVAPFAIIVALVALGFTVGPAAAARALLTPGVLWGVIVLNVALLGWRLVAIGQAGLSGERRQNPVTVAIVVLLIGATLATHLWTGVVLATADKTLAAMFGPTTASWNGVGHLDPQPPTYAWNGTERINILLLGYDSAPGRQEELTDTMMVVSVDPVSHSAALISIPRDTGFVPLPDRHVFADGVYPAKINELASVAGADPATWCPDLPTGADCGTRTLSQALGLYLGITIHHVARIDLLGFASLIDTLGGVEVCLPGRIEDPTYGGPTWYPKVGIVLEAGCHHYDGAHALAYSRSRKGVMVMPDGSVIQQNDYLRAARQQEVLMALQGKLTAANLFTGLPAIMTAVGETVSTDIPRDQAGNLAALATSIDTALISRVVLGWPDYVDPPIDPLTNYLVIPKRDAIRAEMVALFGPDQPLLGWYLGTTDEGPPAS